MILILNGKLDCIIVLNDLYIALLQMQVKIFRLLIFIMDLYTIAKGCMNSKRIFNCLILTKMRT